MCSNTEGGSFFPAVSSNPQSARMPLVIGQGYVPDVISGTWCLEVGRLAEYHVPLARSQQGRYLPVSFSSLLEYHWQFQLVESSLWTALATPKPDVPSSMQRGKTRRLPGLISGGTNLWFCLLMVILCCLVRYFRSGTEGVPSGCQGVQRLRDSARYVSLWSLWWLNTT